MVDFSGCVVAGHMQPGLQMHLRLPGIAQRTLPGLKWWPLNGGVVERYWNCLYTSGLSNSSHLWNKVLQGLAEMNKHYTGEPGAAANKDLLERLCWLTEKQKKKPLPHQSCHLSGLTECSFTLEVICLLNCSSQTPEKQKIFGGNQASVNMSCLHIKH